MEDREDTSQNVINNLSNNTQGAAEEEEYLGNVQHDEAFGDAICLLRDNMLRIEHININGIPASSEDEKKCKAKNSY